MPRWPTLRYAGFLLFVYATLAGLAGLAALVVMVGIARPLWALIFVLGVAAGYLSRRLSRVDVSALLHRLAPWQHVN